MDLVRKILEFAEEYADGIEPVQFELEDHHTVEQVNYHIELCAEAGLLALFGVPAFGNVAVQRISRLTWLGHDRLDEFRRPPRIVPV